MNLLDDVFDIPLDTTKPVGQKNPSIGYLVLEAIRYRVRYRWGKVRCAAMNPVVANLEKSGLLRDEQKLFLKTLSAAKSHNVYLPFPDQKAVMDLNVLSLEYFEVLNLSFVEPVQNNASIQMKQIEPPPKEADDQPVEPPQKKIERMPFDWDAYEEF